MASGTFFVRDCPTCGRKLQARIELLGRDIECTHCGCVFSSTDRDRLKTSELEIDRVLAQADHFIESTANLINPAPSK